MPYFGDGSNLSSVPGVPVGGIIMWSGATNNIPSGWALCDGNNSTPDLRDKFIVGAGSSYAVDATGGSATDTVNISVSGSTGFEQLQTGANHVSTGSLNRRHTHTFSGSGSDTVNTIPPYYALAYIIKT